MVKLASTLSRLSPVRILVIGDLLLDTYTIGKARRISPEAPVAVVHVHHEEDRPGGAGNVALNLISLGSLVKVVGRIGKDRAGECLNRIFLQEKIDTQAIFVQENYKTPVKNRIIAENQQVVRVDYEQVVSLPEHLEQSIIESLPQLMHDIKVVAISDYGKGFLTPMLLNAVINHAKAMGICVITDPKGHDFAKYYGTTLIKPNLSEAYIAANVPLHAALEPVATKILHMTGAEMLMVTRSEAGISLFDSKGGRYDFPVHIRQVKDVTGAGDTVLAMLAYALANELSYQEAAQLCNVAAGIAIERLGCARVTLADLAHRLLEEDVRNKVFDEEHLFALQEVLKCNPFKLLVLNQVKEITQALFQAIKKISSEQHRLLIFVAEAEADDPLIEILASFREIDFILLHQESLRRLCSRVSPQENYLFDKNTLKPVKQIQQLFEKEPALI